MTTNLEWRTATKKRPCYICGKPDWCSRNRSGDVAICRRPKGSSKTTKIDSSGAEYSVHRKEGTKTTGNYTHNKKPEYKSPRKAEDWILNLVYRNFLDGLALDGRALTQMHQRGLMPDDINAGLYKYLPEFLKKNNYNITLLLQKLENIFGIETLLQVPGFYLNTNKRISLTTHDQILIPVRNQHNQIISLKCRLPYDSETGIPKYTYFTSSKHNGPSSGAYVHFPVFGKWNKSHQNLIITEGELKADLASIYFDDPCISIPGVSSWRRSIPEIDRIKPEKVVIAFDMDKSTNPNVDFHHNNFCQELQDRSIKFGVLEW